LRRFGKTEDEFEIGRRHLAGGFFGPLDEAHAIIAEIFGKTGICKLFRLIEAIKIKVIPVYARNYVNFNQGVGRAFHRSVVTEPAQQRAHQRGLAGAEIAGQPDDHARPEQGRELAGQRGARRLVGQAQGQLAAIAAANAAMIRAMQDKNSATNAANAPAAAIGHAASIALVKKIRGWGEELGFAEIGIARADVSAASPGLLRWLALGRHGEMDYMAKHAALRADPGALVPGSLSVISVRLPYWPRAADGEQVLADRALGYVSRYALGRDYHPVLRKRLQQLADRLQAELDRAGQGAGFAYRVFSDSAPVMEVEFARQAGIAWRGKHTLTLTRAGSWHFLGEIYTSLALPPDAPVPEHCGSCRACLDACPTGAIVAPYEVDARLCISYLTIELKGSIPVALRPLIGNRIYGCDDCQLCCPWNRHAQVGDPAFAVRHGLDATPLAELFAWTAAEFESRLAGSPIRRIGHERWLRNVAVALGNAPASAAARASLKARLDHPSALVREHVGWALAATQGK
jgi:epoxyqueuosine reductase